MGLFDDNSDEPTEQDVEFCSSTANRKIKINVDMNKVLRNKSGVPVLSSLGDVIDISDELEEDRQPPWICVDDKQIKSEETLKPPWLKDAPDIEPVKKTLEIPKSQFNSFQSNAMNFMPRQDFQPNVILQQVPFEQPRSFHNFVQNFGPGFFQNNPMGQPQTQQLPIPMFGQQMPHPNYQNVPWTPSPRDPNYQSQGCFQLTSNEAKTSEDLTLNEKTKHVDNMKKQYDEYSGKCAECKSQLEELGKRRTAILKMERTKEYENMLLDLGKEESVLRSKLKGLENVLDMLSKLIHPKSESNVGYTDNRGKSRGTRERSDSYHCKSKSYRKSRSRSRSRERYNRRKDFRRTRSRSRSRSRSKSRSRRHDRPSRSPRKKSVTPIVKHVEKQAETVGKWLEAPHPPVQSDGIQQQLMSSMEMQRQAISVKQGEKWGRETMPSPPAPPKLSSDYSSITMRNSPIDPQLSLSSMDKGQSEVRVNYVHYDPQIHWCRICNLFPKSAKEYLQHLHSKEHKDACVKLSIVDIPWHDAQPIEPPPKYEGAPTEDIPIRGVQFFVPCTGWFCKLCNTWIGDLHCASLHLKSNLHMNEYSNFLSANPTWEYSWMTERAKWYEKQREESMLEEKKKMQEVQGVVDTLKGPMRNFGKRRKKNRRSSSVSSNTSSTDADQSSDSREERGKESRSGKNKKARTTREKHSHYHKNFLEGISANICRKDGKDYKENVRKDSYYKHHDKYWKRDYDKEQTTNKRDKGELHEIQFGGGGGSAGRKVEEELQVPGEDVNEWMKPACNMGKNDDMTRLKAKLKEKAVVKGNQESKVDNNNQQKDHKPAGVKKTVLTPLSTKLTKSADKVEAVKFRLPFIGKMPSKAKSNNNVKDEGKKAVGKKSPGNGLGAIHYDEEKEVAGVVDMDLDEGDDTSQVTDRKKDFDKSLEMLFPPSDHGNSQQNLQTLVITDIIGKIMSHSTDQTTTAPTSEMQNYLKSLVESTVKQQLATKIKQKPETIPLPLVEKRTPIVKKSKNANSQKKRKHLQKLKEKEKELDEEIDVKTEHKSGDLNGTGPKSPSAIPLPMDDDLAMLGIDCNDSAAQKF